MSIFLPSYQHKEVKINVLDTHITPSDTIKQQEIIPIGKNVYLHMLYQKTSTIQFKKKELLTGQFVMYKNKKQNAIILSLYDKSLPVGEKRIYKWKIYNLGRKVKYKDLIYITDRIKQQKLKVYNPKDQHEIIAYGTFEIDQSTQYKLYGYKLDDQSCFRITFITTKTTEHFIRFNLEQIYLETIKNDSE